MKNKVLGILAVVTVLLSSCSKLKSGESFTQVIGGIEYRFEVIVSRMSYVKLTPVAGPDVVVGNIVIPSYGEFDGDKYVVTQIGKDAFRGYTGIVSVKLPSTLSIIESGAFAGCISLTEINTPQPLSEIGAYAFDGCQSLESFSLEASISKLGEAAFRGCSSLQDITFTPTFSDIPAMLCQGCTSITKIDLPSTVMTVGHDAFRGCVSVGSIKMDRSVQIIGDGAFAGCYNVDAIQCLTATPPSCQANSFDGIASNIPVTVPMASLDNYASSLGWNHFYNFKGVYR